MENNVTTIAPRSAVINTPNHIIFATDFSARCDRAQERAIQLALEWNASLTAVHVIEDLGFAVDPGTRMARRRNSLRNAERLRDELAAFRKLDWTVRVEDGSLQSVLLDIVADEPVDLIITGSNQTASITAVSLAQSSSLPILVVKKKVVNTSKRIVTATDLEFSSEPALRLALTWFANREHGLFHAFDPPYQMWVDDGEHYVKTFERSAIDHCEQFLAHICGDRAVDRFDVFVRCGDVVEALSNIVYDADIDLAVVGTHGRTGIMSMLVESVAGRIAGQVESDVLIVPCH